MISIEKHVNITALNCDIFRVSRPSIRLLTTKRYLNLLPRENRFELLMIARLEAKITPPWGHSLIWPKRVWATAQGMVFRVWSLK